jgi:hypothetical protein
MHETMRWTSFQICIGPTNENVHILNVGCNTLAQRLLRDIGPMHVIMRWSHFQICIGPTYKNEHILNVGVTHWPNVLKMHSG